MNRILRVIFLSIISLLLITTALYPLETRYKISSWNLNNFGKKASVSPEYSGRRMAMKSVLDELAPDILAVQEMLSGKGAFVFQDMAGENFSYRCSKFSGTQHQGNCVYWNNKRFRIKDVIYPDLDTQHPPLAVYLEDKITGFDFFIISVHLKFGKSVHDRVDELCRILEFTRDEIIQRDPDVIIAGDFNLPLELINEYIQEDVFTAYIGGFTSRKRDGSGASNYDHFIVSGTITEKNLSEQKPQIASDMVLSVENKFDDVRISDHFPVFFLLEINLPDNNYNNSSGNK